MDNIFDQIKNDPRRNLAESLLMLADSGLILSQRQSEWTGHGPVLEQDIAITNINLDLLGQSRLLYQYVAGIISGITGSTETEDTLAYLRTERNFRNFLICELPNGDWGQTVLRLYLFSVYAKEIVSALAEHEDETIRGISVKSLKEIAYHVKWSSEWVIRLGDGTEESHTRMENAIHALWPYTGEFFMAEPYEVSLELNYEELRQKWMTQVETVLQEATLAIPAQVFMQTGGKKGIHTEHLGYMLAEMQYLQRTYPGAEW